ncbi:hypothetical protein [Sphingomonas bacterium]|uniref:hypothetical protein n=1 Tax=Sphingomonas bacterium TaxID=1895847 RepID=UPI0015764C56|nr:hypothetical protein [Sphingomonas bacterium]
MIELGIREFRERLSEVANGTDIVSVTSNGVEVGTYLPKRWVRDAEKVRQVADAVERARRELGARGMDLDGQMRLLGMTPWGEPLEE